MFPIGPALGVASLGLGVGSFFAGQSRQKQAQEQILQILRERQRRADELAKQIGPRWRAQARRQREVGAGKTLSTLARAGWLQAGGPTEMAQRGVERDYREQLADVEARIAQLRAGFGMQTSQDIAGAIERTTGGTSAAQLGQLGLGAASLFMPQNYGYPPWMMGGYGGSPQVSGTMGGIPGSPQPFLGQSQSNPFMFMG